MTDRLSLTQVIDLAGPIIFGSDWIDHLDKEDIRLMEEFLMRPRGQPNQSIKICRQDRKRGKLDRAIGRDHRLGLQRATVLDWVYSARIMIGRNYCDVAAVKRALAEKRSMSAKPARGRPPDVRLILMRKMLENIRTGTISAVALEKLKDESLAAEYGASCRACKAARTHALAEARRQGLA